MLQESQDLRAEADELHAFLETLGEADWERPTGFMQWTPWDVVAHLHYFDLFSMLALKGEDALRREAGRVRQGHPRGAHHRRDRPPGTR